MEVLDANASNVLFREIHVKSPYMNMYVYNYAKPIPWWCYLGLALEQLRRDSADTVSDKHIMLCLPKKVYLFLIGTCNPPLALLRHVKPAVLCLD